LAFVLTVSLVYINGSFFIVIRVDGWQRIMEITASKLWNFPIFEYLTSHSIR